VSLAGALTREPSAGVSGTGSPPFSGSEAGGAPSPAVGGGSGSARQPRWAATHFSTALARFCPRWNRWATWTASGAPARAPTKAQSDIATV